MCSILYIYVGGGGCKINNTTGLGLNLVELNERIKVFLLPTPIFQTLYLILFNNISI